MVPAHSAGVQSDGRASPIVQRPDGAAEKVGYLGEVRLADELRERERTSAEPGAAAHQVRNRTSRRGSERQHPRCIAGVAGGGLRVIRGRASQTTVEGRAKV